MPSSLNCWTVAGKMRSDDSDAFQAALCPSEALVTLDIILMMILFSSSSSSWSSSSSSGVLGVWGGNF